MRRDAERDPWALDPGDVAWHQSHTFLVEPHTFAERIVESGRFKSEIGREGWGIADWVPPDDEAPFPLGRVTVHPGGILLEAFSETRLAALRRSATELGGGALTADETRSFAIAAVFANPTVLMQPLHERSERALDAHGIAETWLRFVWPFIARDDLGGRTPHLVRGTARGRAALASVVASLPAELRRIPGFPSLAESVLHAILLLEDRTAAPGTEPRSRESGAPRRS